LLAETGRWHEMRNLFNGYRVPWAWVLTQQDEKMKILALTRYSRLGASTRLRTLQYLPYLERTGFHITVAPFFDDAYLTGLYSDRRNIIETLGYFAQRIKTMRRCNDIDLIWIEKEALPWVPWALERALLPRDIPYVVDYDDAVFHRYDQSRHPVVRAALGQKIDGVMAGAACVIAGNRYLADRAVAAGAKRVEVVPTVVDMHRYQVGNVPSADGKLRVGWIGTPQTWRDLGYPIYEALAQELQNGDVVFRAVGAAPSPLRKESLEIIPWTEESEVNAIQGMDIGIMPLTDTPWTRGKCGYKLIQYMACGKPVVASGVGVNNEIVRHEVDGFIVNDTSGWLEKIFILCKNAELRKQMGASSRERAAKQFSLQKWSAELADILMTCEATKET
jgi:glycosyltransferase involved in cell wall biosynthesis